jgi:hypothetical protein
MSKLDYYKKPQYFNGNWKIEKIINNIKHPDQSCTGKGLAKFTAVGDPNSLILNEAVNLVLKGELYPQKATKSYKYEFKGSKVTKYYESKLGQQIEFIKMFDLSFDGSEVIHGRGSYLCENDKYDCIFNFFDENKFSVLYIVSGYNKSYTSTTIFTRDVPTLDIVHLSGVDEEE